MDPALEPGRKRTSTSPVTPIQFTCSDGQVLHGNLFEVNEPLAGTPKAMVVIACATGVRASYYRRYAAFLAGHGLNAVTFDYPGREASAPETLRGFRARGHDWGQLDIERRRPGHLNATPRSRCTSLATASADSVLALPSNSATSHAS